MTNRFFYRWVFPGFSPGDDLILASWLGTWCINYYLPVLGDDVLFIHARAKFMDSASDPWATIPYLGYFGSFGDVAMPANVTMRVRNKERVFGSRQYPYLCVPAPPRSEVVENTFTQAYQDAVVDALSNVYEPTTLLGSTWVWASFEAGGTWRAAAITRRVGVLQPIESVSPRRRRLKNTALYP